MIEASRYLAESRNALSEDLELGQPQGLARETLHLSNTAGVRTSHATALIILCDDVSIFVADIVDKEKSPIAQISGKKLYSNIYQDDVGNMVVVMASPVPEHLLLQWMKILQSFSPEFVFAISSSSQILSSSAEGSLRYIVTSVLSKSLKTGNADQLISFKNLPELATKLAVVEQLGSGTVVTGIVASIISYCEGHSIPAVTLLFSRRAGITLSALKMFDVVLPPLYATIGNNSQGKARPTIQQYKAFVAKDPFTNRTENVYT